MHDHLSLRWLQPGASEAETEPADAIVQLFATGLTERGAENVSITTHDRSWTIGVRLGKRRFTVLLGLTDEGHGEWLVVAISRLSRVRRLFGADDTPHLIGLLRWIEEIAFDSERCVDHAWHTKDAWHESRTRGSA